MDACDCVGTCFTAAPHTSSLAAATTGRLADLSRSRVADPRPSQPARGCRPRSLPALSAMFAACPAAAVGAGVRCAPRVRCTDSCVVLTLVLVLVLLPVCLLLLVFAEVRALCMSMR